MLLGDGGSSAGAIMGFFKGTEIVSSTLDLGEITEGGRGVLKGQVESFSLLATPLPQSHPMSSHAFLSLREPAVV